MGPSLTLMQSFWGVPSPIPAIVKIGKQHDLNHTVSRFLLYYLIGRHPRASFFVIRKTPHLKVPWLPPDDREQDLRSLPPVYEPVWDGGHRHTLTKSRVVRP